MRPQNAVIAALFGGSRWWRSLLGLIVVAAVGIGGLAGIDYVMAPPWAHSHSGHPALVGYWQGVMPVGPGDDRKVVIHMTRYTGRGGNSNNGLTGAAKACGPKGVTHYHVDGKALNRQGTRFRLGFMAQNPKPGKHPGALDSTWDGKDLVKTNTDVYTEASDGASVSSSDDPVIQFDLHRSTEAAFNATCGPA